MAEKSVSRDSDGSWVLAGSEVRGGGGGQQLAERDGQRLRAEVPLYRAEMPLYRGGCRFSQGLQVDTVGPELDSASHGAEDEELEKEEGAQDTDTGRRQP